MSGTGQGLPHLFSPPAFRVLSPTPSVSALRIQQQSESFRKDFLSPRRKALVCYHSLPSTRTRHSKFLSTPCPLLPKRRHSGDQNVHSSLNDFLTQHCLPRLSCYVCALFINKCQSLAELLRHAVLSCNNSTGYFLLTAGFARVVSYTPHYNPAPWGL